MVSLSLLKEPACPSLGDGLCKYLAPTVLALSTFLLGGCFGGRSAEVRHNEQVPTNGAISTRELVELRQISVLSVAPNQQFAVIRVDHQDLAASTTHLTWQVVDLKTSANVGVFDGGSPLWNNNGGIAGEAPHWSPDSNWIYFRKLVGEELQVWRAHRDGTQVSQITHDEADVVGIAIDDSGSLVYAVAGATRDEIKRAEAAEYETGVLMDATVIKGFPISRSYPVNGRLATYRHIQNAWSSRRSTLLGDRPLRVKMIAADGRKSVAVADDKAHAFLTENALEPGYSAASGIARLSPPRLQDGGLLAAITDGTASDGPLRPLSGLWVEWHRIADEPPPTRCEDSRCLEADAIQIVGWRQSQRELVLQTEERGLSRILAWDTAKNSVRTVWEGRGVLGSSESGTMGACQLAGDRAICVAAASELPPRIISIDLGGGNSDILFNPNPAITPSRLGVVSTIGLMDRYGNSALGTLILPRGEPAPPAPKPLVITSYTCRGFLQGGSGRDVPEHVLASRGYAVVCVDLGYQNIRRARGFETTPATSSLSGLDFFESAVDVLADNDVVDPARVVLSGFSGSATITSFAVTRSSKFTAAIVTTGGSADAGNCYLAANYRSCERNARQQGYDRPYDAREGFLKDSPAWNADKVRAPFLMQLPETEYTGMMQLYGALMENDRAVEMYIFPDADHYKHHPRQRLSVYNRNIEWIDFWLRGQESLVPERAEQNARWRSLRERQCALPVNDMKLENAAWYCRAL